MIDRDVELKVGGETYLLRPTLGAMRKINREFDSLVDAMLRVKKVDFNAICFIASAGADHTSKQADQLAESIFEGGVMNAIPAVTEYLGVLMNPTGDDEEEDPSGNP